MLRIAKFTIDSYDAPWHVIPNIVLATHSIVSLSLMFKLSDVEMLSNCLLFSYWFPCDILFTVSRLSIPKYCFIMAWEL